MYVVPSTTYRLTHGELYSHNSLLFEIENTNTNTDTNNNNNNDNKTQSCFQSFEVPQVTKADIQKYLQMFDQSLHKKPQQMYYSKFLKSIRIHKNETSIFVAGRVSAEMKKHVVYTVDIKFDSHNVIQEAQCECAAGMGPEAHCKHTILVLFALTKAQLGIVTQETCTQTLQTFHQAKPHKGSPPKLEQVIFRPSQSSNLSEFDPRPQEFRKKIEYPSHFRNIWQNSTAENIPIRQLYEPANILALCHDHDYLAKRPEESFLDGLKITTITSDEIETIERSTRGQSTNKFWYLERTKRLHASNFGRICTATERTNFENLASSLTVHSEIHSAPLNHGKKYESTAIKAYSVNSGHSVTETGIHVCEEFPYLGCSPDGLVGRDGIIEVKCPFTAKDKEVDPSFISYLYHDGQSLGLKKRHQYHYQIQGTLMCTGRGWCDLVVWTKKGHKVIHIKRDEAFISEMKEKLSTFFQNYFKKAVLDKFLYKSTCKYLFEKQ